MSHYSKLSAMVIGLGSMGKRRVRNLRALGVGRIIGFDVRDDRRNEAGERYGIELVADLERGLSFQPDVLIISTPPHKHLEFAYAAIGAGRPFFMEANCFIEGLAELNAALRGKSLVAAPSRTLWFDDGARRVKEMLDAGKFGPVAEFAHHCGHALPAWHPWEDYRDFYGGQIEAKGAGWDMVGFESYLLTYWFGKVKGVSAFYGKRSSFDTPVDDTFQVLLEFESGALGSVMIDVVSPYAFRTTRIVSEAGVIAWDNGKKTLDVFHAGGIDWTRRTLEPGHIEPGYVAAEEMYIGEIECFLKAVLGEAPYVATFEDELQVMRIVEAVRESRQTGRHVTL
jgi:predicted dehydrogenase